jgi:hypothetical protein
MAELSSEHKRFIVESLACYDTPVMIQSALKERFGVDATLQQIGYYNPENAQGKKELAEEWKTLHAQRRKDFKNEAESIPIALLSFRLRRLQRIVDNPKADKMPIIVKDALKQAAMDAGGMFQRKADESGDDGGQTLATEFIAAIEKIYGQSGGGAKNDVPTESGKQASDP